MVYKNWQHLLIRVEPHKKSYEDLISFRECLDLKSENLKGNSVDSINLAATECEKKGGWV